MKYTPKITVHARQRMAQYGVPEETVLAACRRGYKTTDRKGQTLRHYNGVIVVVARNGDVLTVHPEDNTNRILRNEGRRSKLFGAHYKTPLGELPPVD